MYGLDASHWTYYANGNKAFSPEQLEYCASFLNHIQPEPNFGIRRWIISIANQEIARQQIESIVNFNWPFYYEIFTYRYYYFGNFEVERQQDEEFIAQCRRNLFDIQFHWLDIEDADNGKYRPVQQNKDDINNLINWWAGKCRTGMYGAQWAWNLFLSGVVDFKYMPLWFALWNWEEDLILEPSEQFGGWTRGVMKQTMGSNGGPNDFKFGNGVLSQPLVVDTNYYENYLVPPPEVKPPVPDDMIEVTLAVTGNNINLVLPKNVQLKTFGGK